MGARLKRIFRFLAAALILAVLAFLGGIACVTQPFVPATPSADLGISRIALERDVHALVERWPRSVEDPSQLQAAGDYILEQMRAAGVEPQIQSVEAGGAHYRNIIARFGPSPGPLMVVGAHYDADGETPGADDNASGAAALLELTRLLARTPPEKPVEIVAYTLEEMPWFRTEYMGSVVHARELMRQGREVRLMLALEMIGYFRDEPGTQSYPLPSLRRLYPDTGNYIGLVGGLRDFGVMRQVKALFEGASDLPVESINSPDSVPGIDQSDHASYWQFGMPAIMVTDTAYLRNPNYHGAGDTPDTLDYERMAKVVRAVHAVIMKL